MAEASQTQLADTDSDFEPLSRPRSCTWPLPRPELAAAACIPSPVSFVKHETSDDFISSLSLLEETEEKLLVLCGDFQPMPERAQQQVTPAQRKSGASRRNAWGNMSYADLITRAIESSPEKRLTLSQIYDWMVKSVPYFKDKGDSSSSAGWKNSIRHNLSLHSRFVRAQNEGTGKSSWWTLNPDGGKRGKSPRRRAASMDNNSKFSKSRGRAAKKKMALQGGREGGAESTRSHYGKWPGNSHSNDDLDTWKTFRPCTSSHASALSGHLSPFIDDDLGDSELQKIYSGAGLGSTLPRLSDMTDSISHRENVMENLLDDFHLLSPKNQSAGCTVIPGSVFDRSPSSSSGYSLYSSPEMDAGDQQSQRFYNQTGMGRMLTRQECKSNYVPGAGTFGTSRCTAALLKELLTSDGDPSKLMPPIDTAAPHAAAGRIWLLYTSDRTEPVMLEGCQGPTHSHAHNMHAKATPTSLAPNGQLLLPLICIGHSSAGGAATQTPHGSPSLAPCCTLSSDGYDHSLGTTPSQQQQQDYLPSDLEGMPVEQFECDVESILHESLMDGESLDFNFDPMTSQQGFVSHKVKATSPS